MSTSAPLSPSAPKRFRRRLTTLLVGLAAMLALPGTAFAYTEPVISGSGSMAAPAPVLPAVPSGATSTGSTATTALVIALAVVLVAAIVIVAQRVLRRRTGAPRPVRV